MKLENRDRIRDFPQWIVDVFQAAGLENIHKKGNSISRLLSVPEMDDRSGDRAVILL